MGKQILYQCPTETNKKQIPRKIFWNCTGHDH